MSPELQILELYPREMGVYGDHGNVLTLARRCEWLGVPCAVSTHEVGQPFPSHADVVVGGGGQNTGQERIADDLARISETIIAWAEVGIPMLMVCAMYQLFGREYVTTDGKQLHGLGVLDVTTVSSSTRLTGNAVVDAAEFGRLIGFENHSGRTFLENTVDALGTVGQGHGNNGTDQTEGARTHNVIGTYLHGPILPKNPQMADWLLKRAMSIRGFVPSRIPLDDEVAEHARAQFSRRVGRKN